ncbi:hypothetical protein [Streptomyces netropsis]|uniref:Uncharacterized protein n=1 Tax=Streptomyces netropsis TaxID=55404 RepID=A0A7W7PD59_STRNE|nr:hypothetical protein [Streptomyces netropsis]MBB4885272.1 hypothetical protein [Streptomyces netropsis]GGR27952.1 hypothetical protein GCM10010219_36210 [Streptomyces netropsis]
MRFAVAGTVLRPEGDRLHDGDHYRVRATDHSDRVLCLWLLGVGLSGRTTLVTNDQPSGIALQPDGRDGAAWPPGPTETWWPPDVPYEGTRPEPLLLLIGDSPLDVSPLVSDERERRAGRARGEPLPRLLEEVCDGVRRDSRPRSGELLRYRVVGVHAEVVPRHRKAGE